MECKVIKNISRKDLFSFINKNVYYKANKTPSK